MSRTIRQFQFDGDLDAALDEWAESEGYRLLDDADGCRSYRKGAGFWVAPTFVDVRRQGAGVELEAWVRANVVARIGSLFLLPKEMGVESGGFRMRIPRSTARTAVNTLLQKLQQPEIP